MFLAEDILARMRISPFVPVRITITSGETFEILHPDLVLVGERDIAIGMASKKNPAVYRTMTRVALLHVTAMEDLPIATPERGNGEG
jgi:hypothetical protein